MTDQDDYELHYQYRADGQKSEVKVKNPSNEVIYQVQYYYDSANRLAYLYEPLTEDTPGTPWSLVFDYDKKGNRSQAKYYIDGVIAGDSVTLDYTFDLDNRLTGFATTNSASIPNEVTFSLSGVTVDGLGRLTDANEVLTKTDGNTVAYDLDYSYDRRSQLTYAKNNNIGGSSWDVDFDYHKNGNVDAKEVNSTPTDYSFNGELMTDAGADEIGHDLNGNTVATITADLVYNWDNKLQSGTVGSDSVSIKYDPYGNRVYKESTVSSVTTKRKYIVDVVGELPQILMELDPDNSNSIEKTYVYANDQVMVQYNGDTFADRYFYLHDRLGSVRQLIDPNGTVQNRYTYKPFGVAHSSEKEENTTNPFMFTGQFYDLELALYYLRARQYDPELMRFLARDPERGEFREPLTLHRYLYTANNPINNTDPSGEATYVGLMTGTGWGVGMEAQYAAVATGGLLLAKVLVDQINFRNGLVETLASALERGMEDLVEFSLQTMTVIATFAQQVAGDLIPGSLKRSPSYHGELAGKTVEELEKLARDPDKKLAKKAKDMLKLIRDRNRLLDKIRQKGGR